MISPATNFARHLRHNATDAERLLWSQLRRRQLGGFKFRRQVPIGRYIADFVCLEKSLVIELDGAQHADREAGHDRARDDELERRGFRVLRFWNTDVHVRMEQTLDMIWSELHVLESAITSAPLRPSGTSPLRGEE